MLTLTLLGGHAIAGERVDRSVEFLAYLPVSRWSNMISKLVWPAVMPLLVIGVNATVVYLTVSNTAVPDQRLDSTELLEIVEPIAVVWALGFSVAWLASSVLRSPTFAVACGLMSPIVVGYVLYKFLWTFFVSSLRSDDVSFNVTFVWVGLTVASICFVAGCFHYLLRVEP
jgi:ABC-type transport system involved in multi-copper enzyme maturation permease subunit